MKYLSNSEAACFKRCRRKWWLQWYRKLQPAYKATNDARAKGSRVHEALAEWYVPDAMPRTAPLDALERILARDAPDTSNDPPELAAARLAGWTKETDLERAMVEGYLDWVAESGVDEDLEVIASEQSLAAQLTETVVLIGRLDARVRARSDPDEHWFLDHKTSADFDVLKLRLNQDEQLQTYIVLELANARQTATHDPIQNSVLTSQPSPVAMSFLSGESPDRIHGEAGVLGDSSFGRESREQRDFQSHGVPLRLPHETSLSSIDDRKIEDGRTPTEIKRGSETTTPTISIGGVETQDQRVDAPSQSEPKIDEIRIAGAYYNMLRKVKRTARAKPPFYERHHIRFNQQQISTFITRLRYVAEDIQNLSSRLDKSSETTHAQIAYPTPTKSCQWDCDFSAVCPMFDDGSRAEDMISALYTETPLSLRYPELQELNG